MCLIYHFPVSCIYSCCWMYCSNTGSEIPSIFSHRHYSLLQVPSSHIGWAQGDHLDVMEGLQYIMVGPSVATSSLTPDCLGVVMVSVVDSVWSHLIFLSILSLHPISHHFFPLLWRPLGMYTPCPAFGLGCYLSWPTFVELLPFPLLYFDYSLRILTNRKFFVEGTTWHVYVSCAWRDLSQLKQELYLRPRVKEHIMWEDDITYMKLCVMDRA